jgi:hypothetical protein
MPTSNIPERRRQCVVIARRARDKGLDADPARINRQFRIWLRWYEGRLATGYLIKATGVRRIKDRKE